MAIKFKNEKGKLVNSGDTIYLKLTVPKESSMPFGRFDKIIDTLQKEGMIEILPEIVIKEQ